MAQHSLSRGIRQDAHRLALLLAVGGLACGSRTGLLAEQGAAAGAAARGPGDSAGGSSASSGGSRGVAGAGGTASGTAGTAGQAAGSAGRAGAAGGSGGLCGGMRCDPHAYCDRSRGEPTCVCLPGFTGTGYHCTDVDECAEGLHNCDANATCVNVEGSYECVCNPGFVGNGEQCEDIDECAAGTHDCSPDALCENTQGGYTCTCIPPLVGNGVTCALACPDLEVDSEPPTRIQGSTAESYDYYTAGGCNATPGSADFTILFTPEYTGTYRFDTVDSSFDTVLAVLDGLCAGPEFGCDDDTYGVQSEVLVGLRAGQAATVVVDGKLGAVGDFVVNLNREPCPDATLDRAPPLTFEDSTNGSTSYHSTSCGGASAAADFTLLYIAQQSDDVVFDTRGSDFDTVLALLGEACQGEEVACNDDAHGIQSEVTTYLNAGEAVTVVITGYSGATGNFVLSIN